MTHKSNFPEDHPLAIEAKKKIWLQAVDEVRGRYETLTAELPSPPEKRQPNLLDPENRPTREDWKTICDAVAEKARRKHALLTPEQLAYAESQAQVCRDLMAGMPPMEEQIMERLNAG